MLAYHRVLGPTAFGASHQLRYQNLVNNFSLSILLLDLVRLKDPFPFRVDWFLADQFSLLWLFVLASLGDLVPFSPSHLMGHRMSNHFVKKKKVFFPSFF